MIKWSALRDVAIATACMDDIRRHFRDAIIHLNTMPPAQPFFAADDRFDDVFAIDVRQRGRKLARTRDWIKRVRRGRYDLVIDLQRNDHTRILLSLLRLSGHRVEHRWGCRGGYPYTLPAVAQPASASARQQQIELLRAAGLAIASEIPFFRIPAQQRGAAVMLTKKNGLDRRRFIVFLPGSQAAGRLKRWRTDHFIALGLELLRHGVERVAVIGGPDEVDVCAKIVDGINAVAGNVALNLNMLPLLQIIPLCENAAHIVANDTGNAHIAAAADRPMTVLCGPTDPRRVKPLGRRVTAIRADHPCLNCYGKTCRDAATAACMDALRPEAVAALVV